MEVIILIEIIFYLSIHIYVKYGLYNVSGLPIQQQLLAFRQPARDHRKIIISTNIAESSVTIDHVGYVVDAGLVKLNFYCHEENIDELCIVPISKASAEQRSGRAGRLRPGMYRV
jgi:ATP-dependent RNA helicase DDX35